MIGKIISHYKVLEKIGEGGMGVVYKAEDTKLDRIVALKFLPQYLTTTDTERARFLQEAKAAAALNHPNVCVIHEIQDSADEPFIVMEYINGQTIRDVLGNGRDRSLPIDDALKYAIQIAEALEEAHNNGIVHRDIKSENIMLNAKNQIKVMDFGLAKLKGSLKLVYVMDRNGRNRRRLRSENGAVSSPRWSPDDKWFAYQLGRDIGEASVFVIPANASRTPPRFVTTGALPDWIDSQTIHFLNWDKRTNSRISVQGGDPVPVYEDSTYAVPIMGGDFLFFQDFRKGREGLYIMPAVDAQSQNSDGAREIGDASVTIWTLSPTRRFLLEYHAPGEVWKVSLPDGKRERLGGAFTNPNIEPGSINFSFDDKEAVYATKRISSKLVLIEDFIK